MAETLKHICLKVDGIFPWSREVNAKRLTDAIYRAVPVGILLSEDSSVSDIVIDFDGRTLGEKGRKALEAINSFGKFKDHLIYPGMPEKAETDENA